MGISHRRTILALGCSRLAPRLCAPLDMIAGACASARDRIGYFAVARRVTRVAALATAFNDAVTMSLSMPTPCRVSAPPFLT